MIRGVFLDAGETILHPHPSFPELFSMTCKQRGIDVAARDVEPVLFRLVRSLTQAGAEGYVENWSVTPERSHAFWTGLYRQCSAELGIHDEGLPERLYEVFSDTSTYRLYDDALPAIAALRRAGYLLGLISNFEEWLEEMLVELEVGHLFDVRVISGVEGVEKPDPEIYRVALRRAGVEAAESVHVGDSVRMDVEPAGSIGMKAVLLDRSGTATVDCPTISSLKELDGLVANL